MPNSLRALLSPYRIVIMLGTQQLRLPKVPKSQLISSVFAE